MDIGFIGAGRIASNLARLAIDAGDSVALSNGKSPDTLQEVTAELGPGSRALTTDAAAAFGAIVVVAMPVKGYRGLPVDELAGKVVIDTGNYSAARDGHMAELDSGETTSSELLQTLLTGSRVVKTLNTVLFAHLRLLNRAPGASDRSAVPVAGDDEEAKQIAAAFLNRIGYDADDVGPLSEGWRFQGGAIPYVYSTDGTYESPKPVGAEELEKVLAEAKR